MLEKGRKTKKNRVRAVIPINSAHAHDLGNLSRIKDADVERAVIRKKNFCFHEVREKAFFFFLESYWNHSKKKKKHLEAKFCIISPKFNFSGINKSWRETRQEKGSLLQLGTSTFVPPSLALGWLFGVFFTHLGLKVGFGWVGFFWFFFCRARL